MQGASNHNSQLSITSIDPLAGAMNDSVRIFGTGFSTDTSQDIVTINGVRATITRASATELKIMIPARCFDGTVDVKVNGTSVTGPKLTYFITTGIVTTLAGNQSAGYADGVGTSAQFYSPQAIALDSSGNLFVGDVFNYRIRKVAVSSGAVSTFAGTGNLHYKEGALQLQQFAYTGGIAVNKAGVVYVADNQYNDIRSISSDGTQIIEVAGKVNAQPGYVDGTGTGTRFSAPNGIVFDPNGNLLIVDQHNRAIRKLTFPNTVSTFTAESSAIDFGVAYGIACYLPDGNVYVSDVYHNWIDRFFNDGTYIFSFGAGTQGYVDGLRGVNTEYYSPVGLAIDGHYDIYVGDSGNNCIRMIDGYYNTITIAGSPTGGFTDGTGKAAKFSDPCGLALDDVNHYLYVADAGNNCIRKIALE
jgi:sugar lactone lactonase YvrE